MGTVEFTGLEMIKIWAFGQFAATPLSGINMRLYLDKYENDSYERSQRQVKSNFMHWEQNVPVINEIPT
jgi:hypothetical protein